MVFGHCSIIVIVARPDNLSFRAATIETVKEHCACAFTM
jgi:hypothetical protein